MFDELELQGKPYGTVLSYSSLGKNYCKGSDRTITTPLDKVNDNKVHYN